MNGKYGANTYDCHFTNMAIHLLHNKIKKIMYYLHELLIILLFGN